MGFADDKSLTETEVHLGIQMNNLMTANPTSCAPSIIGTQAPISPKSNYTRAKLTDVDGMVGKVLKTGIGNQKPKFNFKTNESLGKSVQVLGEQFNSIMDIPHVSEYLATEENNLNRSQNQLGRSVNVY